MREDREWNGNFLVPEYENLKLVPELVPSELWNKAPRTFIGNYSWNKVSRYVRERANFTCEICGGKFWLEAHERYKLQGNFLVLARLISVCRHCHLAIHPGYALSNSDNPDQSMRMLVKYVSKINNISFGLADKIIQTCFLNHEVLSNVITEIDYSMLAEESEFARLLSPKALNKAMLSSSRQTWVAFGE